MLYGNMLGFWALLSLIPLIIIYLRRPKPIEKIFPSLMFLLREKGAIQKYSFFRNFIRDLLFLIQLLVLILLSFALAEPYLPTEGLVLGQHNVIVIDASASSQTKNGDLTRFQMEINEAKSHVKGRTSIILAGATPEIVLEDGTGSTALAILDTLKPRDTTTNLEAAMRAAETLVKRGKVFVISDFKQTDGQDPLVVKRILAAKEIVVELIDVGGKASNIGITDMSIDKYSTKVYVKNFNENEVEVKVFLLKKDNVIDQKEKTIKAGSIETFVFTTLPGASIIAIDVQDDFELDNRIFISSPEKINIKTALVVNPKYDPNWVYLKNALESSPEVELDILEPPIIKSAAGYDVIILGGVFSDMVLPSFLKDVSTRVSNGSSFVVAANDNIGNMALSSLLPVKITGTEEKDARMSVNIVNRFTKDIDFSLVKVSKYFTATTDNFTAVVATVNQNPVITFKEMGSGKIVYVGIMDKYSDFKLSPDYPVFWNHLLNFLTGTEKVEDYNLKLEQKPSLYKVGYYTEMSKSIAVNLLNEQESDVSKTTLISEKEKEMSFTSEKTEARFSFVVPITILASLLIFIELYLIKKRGDL